MTLVERLEALARQKSARLAELVFEEDYDFAVADERELLDETIKRLKELEGPVLSGDVTIKTT